MGMFRYLESRLLQLCHRLSSVYSWNMNGVLFTAEQLDTPDHRFVPRFDHRRHEAHGRSLSAFQKLCTPAPKRVMQSLGAGFMPRNRQSVLAGKKLLQDSSNLRHISLALSKRPAQFRLRLFGELAHSDALQRRDRFHGSFQLRFQRLAS